MPNTDLDLRLSVYVGESLALWVAIDQTDLEHCIVSASQRALERFGDDIIGQPVHNLLPPEYRERHTDDLRRALRTMTSERRSMRALTGLPYRLMFETNVRVGFAGDRYAIALLVPTDG